MDNLLCVANFRASTGYAWNFINDLYAGISRRAALRGDAVWVAYREVNTVPEALRDAPAQVVELHVGASPRALFRLVRFIRTERIRVVYLSDRPTWSPLYTIMRAAGVRRIVVHDHSSGERRTPSPVRRLVKRVRAMLPGSSVDALVAVSDFVARRAQVVALVPPQRIHRVWNSIRPAEPSTSEARGRLVESFGIPADRLVVGCSARANRYKGVHHLLRAFDRVVTETGLAATLVYFGDGPALEEWKRLRHTLASREAMILAGYVDEAATLVAGADVAVVPSLWAEAFGMAALEPMSHGVPVIASRVGGLPEIVEHGETGLLVPPADEDALADALLQLLADPHLRERMSRAGRLRARTLFCRERALDRLEPIILGRAS